MKTLKKLVCFVLVLGILVLVLPACTDTGDGEETTTAAATQSGEPDTDGESTARNSLPPGLDFEGAEVKILYWSDTTNADLDIPEQTGSLINDAVWRRDLKCPGEPECQIQLERSARKQVQALGFSSVCPE